MGFDMRSASMQPLPAPRAEQPAVPLCLRQVDSLRALAAGMVMWTHFAETLHPVSRDGPALLAWLHSLPHDFILGRVGVLIFFAISGFVICRSFEGSREGTARRFVIRRFCRLYPAFWLSIPCGILTSWMEGTRVTWFTVAANATMVPQLFGQPFLMEVYWTLQIELVFYLLCLSFFLAGWLERWGVLAGSACALAIYPRAIHEFGKLAGIRRLAGAAEHNVWTISLAVMFWGAAFRLAFDKTDGFRQRPLEHPQTWLLAALTLTVFDFYNPHLKETFLRGPYLAGFANDSFFLAMVVFVLWIACLQIDNHLLTSLGAISYSLYLFHAVVLTFLLPLVQHAQRWGQWAPPLWISMLTCTGLAIALAATTYRWVERPAVALGKRWSGASRNTALPAFPEH